METETINNQTTQQKMEQFVKEHSSVEIVDELVRCDNSLKSLTDSLNICRANSAEMKQKWEQVKSFIVQSVKDNVDISVSELKELAEELEITLTKEVTVEFTVAYQITVECNLDEEVSQDDFTVNLDYNGVGELTNESAEWSDIIIEDE